MFRARILVAALISPLLAVVGLASASPAHAVSAVSVFVSNNVKVSHDGCGSTTVTATGDWAAESDNLITIDVYDRNGQWVWGDLFFDEHTGVVSLDVELCDGLDAQGPVQAVAEVTGWNHGIETTTTGSATFRFEVKPRKNSHIALHKYRIHKGPWVWAVTGKLTRGHQRYAYKRVVIQARIDGYWLDIEKGRTNKRGLVGWEFKPTGYLFRYRFEGDNSTQPTSSAAFRTPHTHGRVTTSVTPGAVTPEALAELVEPLH